MQVGELDGFLNHKQIDKRAKNRDHAADRQRDVERMRSVQQPPCENGREGRNDEAAEVLNGCNRSDDSGRRYRLDESPAGVSRQIREEKRHANAKCGARRTFDVRN